VAKKAVKKAVNGRPPYVPDEKTKGLVFGMAIGGIPHDVIAAQVKITVGTLRKYYLNELDKGGTIARANIATRIYELAMAGNVTLLCFYAKTQMGWREKAPEDLPAQQITVYQGNDLSPEEWAQKYKP
jgi:hypothetical protein